MELARAYELVQSDQTSADELYTIATEFPALNPWIAAHPAAYEGLLDWLRAQGDPQVNAVLQARDQGLLGSAAIAAAGIAPLVMGAEDVVPEAAASAVETHDEAAGAAAAVAEPAAEPITEPVTTEPVAAEPVVTEPVAGEPVSEQVTEPVAEPAAEAAATEPITESVAATVAPEVAAEPVVTEPVVTEPVAGEPVSELGAAPVNEPVAAEPTAEPETEPADAEPAKGSIASEPEYAAPELTPAEAQATQIIGQVSSPLAAAAEIGTMESAAAAKADTEPAWEYGAEAAESQPVTAATPQVPERISRMPQADAATEPLVVPAAGYAATEQYPPVQTTPMQATSAYAPQTAAQPQVDPAYQAQEPKKRGRGLTIFLVTILIIALVALSAAVTLLLVNRNPEPPAKESATTQQQQPNNSSTDTNSDNTDSDNSDSVRYPAPATAIEMSSFAAPSGNIRCDLSSTGVECTINDHTFVLDSECANPSSNPAATVKLSANDISAVCAPRFDSSTNPASLEYGNAVKYGDFACVSSQKGVSCWNVKTGNAFLLSREDAQAGNSGQM